MFTRRAPATLINATGLALGLATFLLVAAYIVDEWSYDRFHEHADRLYRLVGEYTDEHETSAYARVPPAVVPTLLEQVSPVESGVRLQRHSNATRVGDQMQYETDLFFADPSFFDLFTFPLVHGQSETALVAPFSIVLTETTAMRYFGRLDVVGRTVVMGDTLDLVVTGVARDVPSRSHLQFSGLISFATYERMRPENDLDTIWTWGTSYSYVRLAAGSDRTSAQVQITRAIDERLGSRQEDGIRFNARLQPVTEIHLSSGIEQTMSPGGSARYVIVFGLIGLSVLIIAGINFVNLSTARASVRATEVGVRKAAGASRQRLLSQFMAEALALSLAALVIAVALVALAMPGFAQITGKHLALADFLNVSFVAGSLGVALLAGAACGVYPSVYLASFRPAAVLKPGRAAGGARSARHRRVLVVLQFTASIFLIGGTLVAKRQVDHLRSKELGFDRERVVVVPFHWDPVVQGRYDAVRDRLASVPAVLDVTASGDVPGRMFTSMSVWAEGMPENTSKGANALIVDPDFSEAYGLDVIAGRDFSRDHPADWDDAFMLNESAAHLMGWTPEQAVGRRFYMNGFGTVVGVFRDFHYEGVQKEVEPIVFAMWPSWYGYFSLRLAGGSTVSTLEGLESAWMEAVPERPFEYFFLDADFDRQYQAETRFGALFLALSVLAIVVACLGLYGLAAFVAERRTREIGIRKVLGAHPVGLVALLAREFMMLIAVAFAVAAPLTWMIMNRWLTGFASREDVTIGTLVGAGVLALLVALVPVGIHAFRAACTNPVRCLRYE